MKLTVLHKNKVQQTQQLIQLSCKTNLTWINNNVHDTKYLIQQICHRNHLTYNLQIGSICAHIAKHYRTNKMKQNFSDVLTAEKIINKFYLVFANSHQNQSLYTIQDLANYGRYCIMLTTKPVFRESIPNKQEFNVRLKEIVRHLLSSLLFQYLPVDYSDLLLRLYLQEYQTEDEKEWIVNNKNLYKDIYPYHDFFQIISSLSYHILNTRKVIDSQHYLQILSNPTAGSVEWPMVLGVRNLHQLPRLK